MATNFPSGLDTTSNLKNTWVDSDSAAAAHVAAHNNLADAVLAIENTLGINVNGAASDVATRLSVISNFVAPNAGAYISGNYYDNAFQGSASGTLAGTANIMDLAPFYSSATVAINQLGVAVSTAVASAQVKVVIYGSDANGWPGALLHESAAITAATTGYQSETLSFTFSAATQYWVGVRHSSTSTLRTVAVASAKNLGLGGSNTANYFTILRRTLAFATAAPNPWGFVTADLVNNVTPPSVRFRAA